MEEQPSDTEVSEEPNEEEPVNYDSDSDSYPRRRYPIFLQCQV
jgi:hypothetical protein